MVSRRIADDRLGFLKDDLLMALQRVQFDLDMYDQDHADNAPLETMIDALTQMRSPLEVLEHREAVVLLDEMRQAALERAGGAAVDFSCWRQATDQLKGYLQASLVLGGRRSDTPLLEATEAVRQARQRASPQVNRILDTGLLEPDPPAIHEIQDVLKRLQHTIAGPLEQAADQPGSWSALHTGSTAHRQSQSRKYLPARADQRRG